MFQGPRCLAYTTASLFSCAGVAAAAAMGDWGEKDAPDHAPASQPGAGGKKMPPITRPQVSRVLRELLPHRTWTRAELLQWLSATQERNERAKLSHIKRRLRRQHDRASLPLVA